MRKQHISHALRLIPPALASLLFFSTHLYSQTPGDTTARWGNWWYGIYGGVNYSSFDGSINDFENLADPFTAGSGIGLAAGGVLEYNAGDLLGFNLMLGYDARPVTFDEVRTEPESMPGVVYTDNLATRFSYLAIEPSLRINLGSRFFHLLLGPGLGFNLGKGSDYTRDSNGTVIRNSNDLDLETVQSFAADIRAAVGYDIPLAGPESNTQILLTPFAEFRMALTDYIDSDPDEFKRIGLRGGVMLKFGSRPTSPVIEGPDGRPISYDFRVDAPVVIAESRRVNETFPLRNYVFFDPGSTAIPARYTKLSRAQAESFREEQLLKLEGTTGSGSTDQKRSMRQKAVYYQVLNIFGDRMRRNPAAKITLTGAGNGDAAKGKEMAEAVKQYLVSTFGIPAERITTKGAAMPTNKSGSGSSVGEDRSMIDAENWRVEIESTPDDLLAPVNIITLEEEPIGNDVIFRLNPDDNVESTTIEITDRNGATRTFGPYTGSQDVRLDARDLLGVGNREGRFTARTVYTLKDGMTFEAKGKEFRLVRADPDEEQTGIRYSILFEFDQSKTVKTYEQFLRETVAPAIPNGSTVIIHGHTDAIGTPEHNNKLAEGRVDETRRVLTDALEKMGRKVTFDSYGFGEDDKRAPFANQQPEERYYNRTVVIEIVPGG